MQLVLLITMVLLTTKALAADGSGEPRTMEALEERYDAIQRDRNDKNSKEPGKIKMKIKYRHHHRSIHVPNDQVQSVSDSYIECVQGELNSNYIFDFPMKVGWLYNSFSEAGDTTKKYFDTSASEHWAFPNFSCNFKNVLAGVSWLRSGKKAAFKENKNLHSKFKDHKPPTYSETKYFAHNRRGGVYCEWDGWLYPSSNIGYEYFIDTSRDDELFTLLNVYCHKRSVRMFYSAKASRGGQQKKDNKHPFKGISPPSLVGDSSYPSVLCNWDGWLYGDMSGNTWIDGEDKKRYGYEKYFAIDKRGTGESDKDWLRGRVANPFCSRDKNRRYGIVTAVRAYCFFPIRVRNSSDNIKRLQEQHCQGL